MDLNTIIVEHLARGEKGAVATIVRKDGAAPRDEGARMFVAPTGKIFGTIGGGSVEAETCTVAREVIGTGRYRMLEYRMDGKDVAENDMVCGGNVDIFIEPVEERQKDVYIACVNATKRGTAGYLVTRYSERGILKSLVTGDGTVIGDPVDVEMIASLPAATAKPAFSEGFIAMPLIARSRLYIFGAGHVSQYISRIADLVGFDVTIIDDRADFANQDRFPEARSTVVRGFDTIIDYLSFTGSEYVVIVTRGHKHDALVLEQTIRQPTRYLGMIGSRRKIHLVFDHVRAKGVPDSLIERVFAPIGVDIKAETPEEIAVSIMAEIIKVRHNPDYRRGTTMEEAAAPPTSDRHSPDHHKALFG
jgi:xanthine dehydrogenase accessory factor